MYICLYTTAILLGIRMYSICVRMTVKSVSYLRYLVSGVKSLWVYTHCQTLCNDHRLTLPSATEQSDKQTKSLPLQWK